MILVLNCGSQSVKWKLFELSGKNLAVKKEGSVPITSKDSYDTVLVAELSKLKQYKEQIEKIGHRVVHGADKFIEPVKITDSVLEGLEELNHLAPLHNPYNILGIKICQNIFRDSSASWQPIPQFAVFDTEFFSNLPELAFTYALPDAVVKKFKFKRFGFQGTSHEFVAKEAVKKVGKPFSKLKIITCHLGGGASISAIKNGKAIDTSMGFTPLEGLVMMTRSGSMDPGIILDMTEKLSVEKTREILNLESGLKGICGANNMLEVLDMIKKGDKKAMLALDVFVYSIKKYIGAYFAVLGGCDLFVFTGAIGYGSAKIRNMILKDLIILSKSRILAVETDEELAIAQKIINL